MPTWKPLRAPSLAAAARGTPKFASTRIQSKRYTSPSPTDTEGCASIAFAFCASVFPACASVSIFLHCGARQLVPGSRASRRPALTNACALTGQCGLRGRSDTTPSPAAQYVSPPSESVPSRGPMLLARKSRTFVGPPSWKRSGKSVGRPSSGTSAPARAPNDHVCAPSAPGGKDSGDAHHARDVWHAPAELVLALSLVERSVAAERPARELVREARERATRALDLVVLRVKHPRVRQRRLGARPRREAHATVYVSVGTERCSADGQYLYDAVGVRSEMTRSAALYATSCVPRPSAWVCKGTHASAQAGVCAHELTAP
jgi:hypothetical protein